MAVRRVQSFDLVHFNSASLNKAGTATQTSTGVFVGVDAGYMDMTHLFGDSQGAMRSDRRNLLLQTLPLAAFFARIY